MNLRQPQARIQLSAIASPPADAANTTGEVAIGKPLGLINLTGADVAYSCRAILASGDKLELNIPDGDTSASTLTEFPAITTVAPAGVPQFMIVGGTLTDGTDPVVFPILLYTGDVSGKPSYRDAPGDYSLVWQPTPPAWIMRDDITDSAWVAPDDTPFPDAADWNASAISPATGTPTVTAASKSPIIENNNDKDIYGRDIPTLTKVQGLLVEVISGSLEIEVNGEELKTATAGETRLIAAANGIPSLLEALEATASANDTEIKITIIGES